MKIIKKDYDRSIDLSMTSSKNDRHSWFACLMIFRNNDFVTRDWMTSNLLFSFVDMNVMPKRSFVDWLIDRLIDRLGSTQRQRSLVPSRKNITTYNKEEEFDLQLHSFAFIYYSKKCLYEKEHSIWVPIPVRWLPRLCSWVRPSWLPLRR